MRIQEVEPLTGITKKNIRFYEQEGLLHPRRLSTNVYRDYSDTEVLLLRQIRLLRQLGVPLEEIRRMQDGALTVGDAMTRQGIFLQREIRNLELCVSLCQQMETLNLALSSLDPNPYLEEMEQLKQKGARFMDHRNQDVSKKVAPSVISALVMILMMVGIIGILIWAQTVDPIPLPIWLFLAFFPAVVCVGVLLALRSRWKELKQGDEENIDKY